MGEDSDLPHLEREREGTDPDTPDPSPRTGDADILLPAEAIDSPPFLAEEPPQSTVEPAPRPKARTGRAAEAREREIGAPVHDELTRRFLQIDPTEGFDIQALNELRLEGVAPSGAYDPKLLQEVAVRAEELMVRVKAEVDDPLSAAPFLTEQVLAWFRQSATDAEWAARMPRRWAGLFAQSRISGGKLQTWLNFRLDRVRVEAIRLAGLGSRIRASFSGGKRIEDVLVRGLMQQIQGEVAQAILDDLAVHPWSNDRALPLVRLSELAVRRQVQTINEALAVLFTSPDGGPFVLLHPNRYPDCPELVVRPPVWGASGASLAYHVVAVRREERTERRSRRPRGRSRGEGSDAGDEMGEGGEYGSSQPGAIWERTDLDADFWREAIEEARRTRRRLDPPPKDFRVREAYAALRCVLLESAELRPLFLAVRWRGRPSGLALVVSLISKGSLSPEVLTDHEYLDAELSDLAKSDPDWKPENGEWEFSGWKVQREGDHRDGFRYRAEPSRSPAH